MVQDLKFKDFNLLGCLFEISVPISRRCDLNIVFVTIHSLTYSVFPIFGSVRTFHLISVWPKNTPSNTWSRRVLKISLGFIDLSLRLKCLFINVF